MAAGIEVRHAKNGHPSYRANVWSNRDGKRIRKTFPTEAAAKAWRQDAQVALRRGTMRAPSPLTVRQAADDWIAGAKDGSIRNRSGDRYKPSTIRGYEQALRLKLVPEIGSQRLSELRLTDVQDVADKLIGKGVDPSTIRNALMPLRALCRRALARGELAVNPTSGVELPAVRGRRDRIVTPKQATVLLNALPVGERALWATAIYAGLRMGELRALRWEDVDLAQGVIRVRRSWDAREGVIAPKTRNGERAVPIASGLRDYLAEHGMTVGRSEGFVFGRSAESPFDPSTVNDRAHRAWKKAKRPRITLHEGRHTFASLMIAAGVNAKALSTYMGHASITITLDRYGHLMLGNEDEAAGQLDAYLARAAEADDCPEDCPIAASESVTQEA